jgi:hypothetical protein
MFQIYYRLNHQFHSLLEHELSEERNHINELLV